MPLGLIQLNFGRFYMRLHNIQDFYITPDPVTHLPTGAFWITAFINFFIVMRLGRKVAEITIPAVKFIYSLRD
jgi:hypothetical protein